MVRRFGPFAAALVASLALVTFAVVGGSGAGAVVTGTEDWTVYHGDPTGSGVAAGSVLSTPHAVWTSPDLDGQLYGEPLIFNGSVFAATENDTVVALSASTGQVQWQQHLATPVPASDLPCGDIKPTVGITGTPVIDPSRSEIFVVADELVNGSPSHHLVGLSTSNGSVLTDQVVDPPAVNTAAILQRTGLTLDAGQVVFGYGGNYGDCSSYHGWVMAAPEGGGAARSYESDSASGQSQGAIWMGGAAPVVDAAGNIWVGVGNGSVTSAGAPYDHSDAVLEISSSLSLLAYFAPSEWNEDNADDLDLGSSAPALVGSDLAFQAGKSGIGYVLDRQALGGVGGQKASRGGVCNGEVDGGDAVSGTTVYVPCATGVTAVSIAPTGTSLSVAWHTSSGSPGPPILVGGVLFTINQSGTLFGLNPSTGATVEQFALGPVANHFPTPAFGEGLLLAPSADQVHAFAAAATTPSTPPTSAVEHPHARATTTTTPHGQGAGGGGWPVWATITLLVGVAAALLGIVTWRRRRRPQ